MHPWDTLILLVSIAVCSCDSSNFSFDVECVLTSASAHPCTTCEFFYSRPFSTFILVPLQAKPK
jgi:hypothetical protein